MRAFVLSLASVRRLVETTKPTAGRAVELLVAAGVLVETTGKKRDRLFVYLGYLDLLRVGTELAAARGLGDAAGRGGRLICATSRHSSLPGHRTAQTRCRAIEAASIFRS